MLSFRTSMQPLCAAKRGSALITPLQVKSHRSVPLHAELYHCTMTSHAFYMIKSRDPVSSNQMTRIYIGVI